MIQKFIFYQIYFNIIYN